MYRLFDQSSKEKMLITLGTSPLFAVRIFDFEVTSNLRFCFDAFEDKCHMKGVTQLQSIIIGMCNSGKATRKDDPRGLLQSCVKSVLEMALQGVAVLDGAKEQDAERKERHDSAKASSSASTSSTLVSPVTTAAADAVTDGDESKKLFKTKNEEILLRQTSRLQMEIYDTIVSLRQNDIAWNNLNGTSQYSAVQYTMQYKSSRRIMFVKNSVSYKMLLCVSQRYLLIIDPILFYPV